MNEERLRKALEQAISRLLSRIDNADLTTEGAEGALLRQIHSILDQLGRTLEEVVPPAVIYEYFGGVDEASRLLAAAGAAVPAGMAVNANGLINQGFQRAIHLDAVQAILEDTMLDLNAAINTAKQSADATILTTLGQVRQDIAEGFLVGDPRKIVQSRVAESFLQRGMTAFITEDGRSLPLNFYAMTVTRTKQREAAVRGSTNRYRELGQDLVKITGNGDSCSVCAQYNGLVVSLTGETDGFPTVGQNGIRLGPYHPNCRCGTRPFVLERASSQEVAEAKRTNDQYAPGKDRRTPAQKRAYEREQALRRKANAELKQFMRWQAALGADVPKTLAAFRRMKRQNTAKFQELQSAFRSWAMTNKP